MEICDWQHLLKNKFSKMKKKNGFLASFPKSYLFVFLTLLLTACNKNSNNGAVAGGAAAESILTSNESPTDQPDPLTRKLIKEGNIAFETTDLIQTRRRIEQAIKKHNGYISSENENNLSGSLSCTLIIRIPAKQFDVFISDVTKGIKKFDTKDIQVKDVTEEFVDIQARLKTKRELEQRYLKLLDRANKVTEILEIEKQIGDLRADIEGTEGRLQYLNNQSVYSTISVTYYKSIPKQTAFTNKFKEGFSNGWQNFMWFLVGLVNMWPFLLVIGIAFFLLKRWWRRRKVN